MFRIAAVSLFFLALASAVGGMAGLLAFKNLPSCSYQAACAYGALANAVLIGFATAVVTAIVLFCMYFRMPARKSNT